MPFVSGLIGEIWLDRDVVNYTRTVEGVWRFDCGGRSMREISVRDLLPDPKAWQGPYSFGTGSVLFNLRDLAFCCLEPLNQPVKATAFLGARRAGKSRLIAQAGRITKADEEIARTVDETFGVGYWQSQWVTRSEAAKRWGIVDEVESIVRTKRKLEAALVNGPRKYFDE